jgi:hypothetical protein
VDAAGNESDLAATPAVPFPTGLPGDVKGKLTIHAAIRSPAELEGSAIDVQVTGTPARAWSRDPPRALWSSRPPLPVVGTIVFLALCVWSTYAFVAAQLLALKNLKQER